MFAFEIPNLRFSLPAGAAIKANQFVTVDSSGRAIVCTDTLRPIGVIKNEISAKVDRGVEPTDQIAEIQDGIVMVEAGASISAGAAVSCNATGYAIPATETSIVVGVSLTDATAAGICIAVKLFV